MIRFPQRRLSALGGVFLLVLCLTIPWGSAAQGFRRYIVTFGDTPARIAERYGLTVEQLLAANGLPNDAILHPGDELILPTRWTAAEYVVRPGETLADIAAQYGLSPDLIAHHNGLWQADRIEVGQVLLIPAVNPAFEGLAARALRILAPLPGSIVRGEITLQGMGASPDNVVLISATDAQGRTLFETWAPVWAEIGQPGRFSAKLDLRPYEAGPITLAIWSRNLHNGTPREKVSLALVIGAP